MYTQHYSPGHWFHGFADLTGTIPVRRKKSPKPWMGEQSLKTVPAGGRPSLGFVNSAVNVVTGHRFCCSAWNERFWLWNVIYCTFVLSTGVNVNHQRTKRRDGISVQLAWNSRGSRTASRAPPPLIKTAVFVNNKLMKSLDWLHQQSRLGFLSMIETHWFNEAFSFSTTESHCEKALSPPPVVVIYFYCVQLKDTSKYWSENQNVFNSD